MILLYDEKDELYGCYLVTKEDNADVREINEQFIAETIYNDYTCGR